VTEAEVVEAPDCDSGSKAGASPVGHPNRAGAQRPARGSYPRTAWINTRTREPPAPETTKQHRVSTLVYFRWPENRTTGTRWSIPRLVASRSCEPGPVVWRP